MASNAQPVAAGPRSGDFSMQTDYQKEMIWFYNMTPEDAAKLREKIQNTDRPLVQPNPFKPNYVCLLTANGPMDNKINQTIIKAACELLFGGPPKQAASGADNRT